MDAIILSLSTTASFRTTPHYELAEAQRNRSSGLRYAHAAEDFAVSDTSISLAVIRIGIFAKESNLVPYETSGIGEFGFDTARIGLINRAGI